MRMSGGCRKTLAVLAGLTLGACGANDDDAASLGRVSSSIVGGTPSTEEEDFTVFIASESARGMLHCAGVLVAPNLVLTVRHCVTETSIPGLDRTYSCDATGEPPPGGGGFVTGAIPLAGIHVLAGRDAPKRLAEGVDKGVSPSAILDDGSASLCSHDFAALVLSEPLSGVPLAKLRLHRRPNVGPGADRLAVAGWGGDGHLVERVLMRQRRDDLVVVSVGAPSLGKAGEGDAIPRTFETTVGPCTKDSGGPVFDPASSALAGLVARDNGFADNPTGSRCLAPGATVAHMLITDFGDVLHRAFASAGALPTVEGREAPGWVSFGERCTLDVECSSNVCEGTPGAATCNVDCRTESCPADLACDARSRCSTPPPVSAPAEESPPSSALPVSRRLPADDCGVAPGRVSMRSPSLVMLLVGALGLVVRRRRRLSRCANGSSSPRS